MSQHGFLSKHSIFTNVLIYRNSLIDSLDQGYQIDSIYTNFQRAFDKVVHSLLSVKLKYFEFDCYSLNWLFLYICNRTKVVKISFHIPINTKLPWEFHKNLI